MEKVPKDLIYLQALGHKVREYDSPKAYLNMILVCRRRSRLIPK